VTNTKEKEQTLDGSVSIKLNRGNGKSGTSGASEPSGNTKGNAGSGKTDVSLIL
jgi:hypothetical protein